MLTPYYLTRFDCPSCGTFETGTPDRPDLAAKCPWCDGDLITTAQCRGMTSRPLPFTSDARIERPISDTPVETIGDNVREKRQRNHGHRKATGRPRGDGTGATYRKGDKDTREQDHDRYQKRKQDGRRPADTSGGLEE